MQHGLGSLRGAIGTPAQITELVRRYEAVGVDQVVFVLQAGANKHEHICEALELFGRAGAAAFAAEREERDAEKAARLAPAIERALARKAGPRPPVPGYVIDEPAEMARAERASRPPVGVRARAVDLVAEAQHALQGLGKEGLAGWCAAPPIPSSSGASATPSPSEPCSAGWPGRSTRKFAFGFEGDIVYELSHAGNGRAPDRWTIRVAGDCA